MEMKPIRVAFVGNPNCGKTTLFNAVTGSKLKVANWPGVTVEKKEGEAFYEDWKLTVVDTPGIYSLTCYTIEEKVTRQAVMDDTIDVIVNVVDASSLERNLYLTLQLLELGKPVILALNMMDVVMERGMEIDLHRLPELLGNIPVIPVSATKKTGLSVLLHGVVHHYEEGPKGTVVYYGDVLEEKIKKLEQFIGETLLVHGNPRWIAIKILEGDEEVVKNYPSQKNGIGDKSYEKEIIQIKYGYIEEVMKECLHHKAGKEEATDKVDALLTHPVLGVPIFLLIMLFVFFMTFTVGDGLKGIFEQGLEWISVNVEAGLYAIHGQPWLISLIIDGIIAGVGGILTFLPNIFILFLALAILEDSGYMSRVAYVMDGIMGRAGLSGKAFLPMILGFGCTVPAIMATRALERQEDRLKTMLVVPFMSCSARLPIYILFAGMFFEKYHALAAFSMYGIGMAVAVIVAQVLHKWEGGEAKNPLLIELPEYKRPNVRTIWIYVWNKLKDYLTKAGTTIFLASILIWAVLNFGPSGMIEDPSLSFGASIGKLLVPIMAPAGLGMWQIVVALISGISAKEVVVSSFSVLFGAANAHSPEGMDRLAEAVRDINPGFGPLNAYALMLFCLLYTPCIAAIATIKKESRSWKFTIGTIAFQLFFAWTAAVVVYQVGSFIFP